MTKDNPIAQLCYELYEVKQRLGLIRVIAEEIDTLGNIEAAKSRGIDIVNICDFYSTFEATQCK